MEKIAMTYQTEKDDNGDEALFMRRSFTKTSSTWIGRAGTMMPRLMAKDA
jgi:hypothetical protein